MKNFFKKFKNYSFWVSLSASVIILLNVLGKIFGFQIENQIVEDCIMAVAGLLVVLGVVSGKPASNSQDKQNQSDEQIKNNPNDE